MTTIFDGLSGALNDVFGAPVAIRPGGVFDPVTVRAIFRETPVEVAAADGRPVVVTSPTVQVQRDAAAVPARGDTVQPSIAPGRWFRVLDVMPTASPASDGFVVAELEEIKP